MKFTKILLIVAMILLIGFVLFFYNAFNGNPVSKFLSKKELQAHLEETYPGREFTVSGGAYNFKDGGYDFTVVEVGSGRGGEYRFFVRGFIIPQVVRDGIYDENLDVVLAERLNEQIVAEISPLIAERVGSLRDIKFYIEVLKGTYPDDVKWSKELAFEKPMDIFVGLDSTNQSKEDFLKDTVVIKNILDERGYHYDKIVFNGSGFDLGGKDSDSGYLKYAVSVKKDGEIKERNIKEYNEELWK